MSVTDLIAPVLVVVLVQFVIVLGWKRFQDAFSPLSDIEN